MDVLSDAARAGSRLERLLEVSVGSRLHLAMALVGREKMPAEVVLELRWPQVDLTTGVLVCDHGIYAMDPVVGELFYWHGALQRVDAWRTPGWPDTGRVFVNRHGVPIGMEHADAQVAHFCGLAGLAPVPLSGLRHPSWALA